MQRLSFRHPLRPLLIGILGLVLVPLALAGLGWWWAWTWHGADFAQLPPGSNPPAEQAPPGFRTFVNSPEGLTGDRRRHYTDFSFRYPTSWQLVADQPRWQQDNYVTVLRCAPTMRPAAALCRYPAELFAVGAFWGPDTIQGTEPELVDLLQRYRQALQQQIPAVQIVAETVVELGDLTGYEIRYVGKNPDFIRDGRSLTLWGRDLLLPDGQGRGVRLMLLATSLSDRVQRLEDLTAPGEVTTILDSFKFLARSTEAADNGFFWDPGGFLRPNVE